MYGMPGAEGLAGRMVNELFGILDGLQDSGTVSVEGSMAEIYNSSIIDLLRCQPTGYNSRQSSKETTTSVLRQLNKEWGAGAVRQSSKEKQPKLRQSKEGTFQVDD